MQEEATWQLDPVHSGVEFSVRHMMIANVRGKFAKYSIDFHGDFGDLEHSEVSVTIDASSIDTGEEKRDAHLRSDDFFGVEKYREIKFQSSSIRKVSDNEYDISGILHIKGISRQVSLHGTFEGQLVDPYGNLRAGVTVSGEITREDFGIKYNSILETGGVLLGSKVKFEAHIEIIRRE